MKRLLLAILILTCGANLVFAAEQLRTSEYIEIVNGDIQTSGVLADSDGTIFIEFPKTIRVTHDTDKTFFDGEILPPEIVLLDARAPRARMRQISAFEILGNDGENLDFLDRVILMDDKTKIKKSYNDPEFEITNSQVRVFFMVPYEPETRNLALWEYIKDEDKWLPFGGKTEITDDGQKLFTSAIRGTGVFAFFDENPPPSFIAPHPINQIYKVEETDLTPIDEDPIKPYNPDKEINPDEVHIIYAVNDLTSGNEVVPAIDEDGVTNLEFEETEETTDTKNNNLSDGLIVPAVTEDMTESTIPASISDNLSGTEDKEGLENDKTVLPIDGKLPKTGADEEGGFSFPFGIVFALGILGLGTFFIMREERY